MKSILITRIKFSESKKNYHTKYGQWNQFSRKEEETIRDANGFIVLDNPQEYGKITELWKPKKSKKNVVGKTSVTTRKSQYKKENCNSQKTTTNSGEQSNNINSKVKFFETFDQMTQHMKEKTKQKASVSELSNKIHKKKRTSRKKHSQESSDKKSTKSRKKKNLRSDTSLRE